MFVSLTDQNDYRSSCFFDDGMVDKGELLLSRHPCSCGKSRLYVYDADGHYIGMCMGVHLQIEMHFEGIGSTARFRAWPFYARNIWW